MATPGVNRWVEEELQSTDNQAGGIRGYENCGAKTWRSHGNKGGMGDDGDNLKVFRYLGRQRGLVKGWAQIATSSRFSRGSRDLLSFKY